MTILQNILGYSALAGVLLVAFVFYLAIIQCVIHPPSLKSDAGKTTRISSRSSLHAPVTQEPYPMQTPADGEIVLAQWYKYFGTPEEKEKALALLKRRGYGEA